MCKCEQGTALRNCAGARPQALHAVHQRARLGRVCPFRQAIAKLRAQHNAAVRRVREAAGAVAGGAARAGGAAAAAVQAAAAKVGSALPGRSTARDGGGETPEE